MKEIALILPLIFLTTAGQVSADHYQIYLLGGQSNGNGRADAAQLAAPLNTAQTDVLFYWHRTQAADNVGWLVENQWINLAPGSGHGTGEPVFAKEFGPEVSFGRAMADAKPSENIAIIKYTHGGTTLETDWSATGPRYATFVATVQAALSALTTAGHTYDLRGMLWVQGETDSNTTTSSNSYQTNLTNLITRVRTDLNGGQPLPFVLSSLSNSQYANITTVGSGPFKVRQAQETVAAASPTVGIVITDGYSVRPDVIHFDHTALVSMGQGLATEMVSLETAAATSLIHHWKFDAGLNDSVGTHHGTAAGNATLTTGTGGKFGEAVTLDGAGDYVQVGQASLPATDYTLTAWIKRDTAGDFMYVAGTQLSATAGNFLRVEPATGVTTPTSALFANLLPPATSLRAWSAPGTIPLNQWTHVAMSVSSTAGLTIYINGTAAGTDPAATAHTVHNNFRIGARPDGTSSYFDGLIDDVAIFDGVLTQTQLGHVITHGAANFEGVTDNTPPATTTLAPGDGALTVDANNNLVITFNETVRKGASGNIVIKENGGATFETIPVTDASVGISGSTVTINPAGTLALNQRYHVQIHAGTIEDLAGNAWSGIADTDSTTWNFATYDADKSAGTTGVFDENLDATNELDIEIPASSLGVFKSSVLAAHNQNLGGVIDWETGVATTPSETTVSNNHFSSIVATYGVGADRFLIVTFDRPMDLYTNDINNQVSVLSRSGSLHNALIAGGGNDPVGLEYTMTFTGSAVIELGAAIPSRSTYGSLGVDFRATATFSGGGSETIDFTAGGTAGTGDTFLPFKAPANQTITAVSFEYVDDNGQLLANSQRRPVIDDLGFIVAEPASNTFSAWIANPAFGLDAGDQDFPDDPDGDGLPNGVEAWFGTHPGEFNPGLAQVATNGTITTFTHSRNDSLPSDLTGYYEWSPNLVDWYAGDGIEGPSSGITVNIVPDVVGTSTTVTATSSGPTGRLFFGARVVID